MSLTWSTLMGYPQTYTASDTGGIIPNPQVYVPSQYPLYSGTNNIGQLNSYGPAQHNPLLPPNPIPQNPALSVKPTGRLVTVYYRDPATGQDIALSVDETFYAIMLSINQQQVLTVYDAAGPCWANPATGNADFSLDEMTEAEKVIEEMKREAACA